MAEIAKEFVFDPAEPVDLVQNGNRVHADVLWKCFPSSTQIAIPFEYYVPKSYLTIEFWNKQLYRLGDWRRMWAKQMTSFKQLVHQRRNAEKNSSISEAIEAIDHVGECYDLLIERCWAGNMASPPLPVELWSSLMSELHRIDQAAKVCIRGMGFNNFTVATFPDPPVHTTFESHESIAKRLEELGEAGPLFAFIARNLSQFEDYRERKIIASDCDYSLLTKIIDTLESGKNEMTYSIYNELKKNCEKLFKKFSEASTKGRLPYSHLPPSLDELQEIVAEELGAIDEKPTRKRSRRSKSSAKMENLEEEMEIEAVEKKTTATRGRKRATPVAVAPSTSRPKRIRKPARSFTPTQQSSDSGNVSEEEKLKEMAKVEEEALSETSYHRESSPEMEDFVVMPSPTRTSRKKKNLAVELEEMPDPEEQPIQKRSRSVKTAEEVADDPNELVTEKDIMLLNERVYMETTRMNLLRLRNNKGEFHYDYIPTILECVDRAVEALDEGQIVDYVMHKASVETGAEHILQLSKNNDNNGGEGVITVSPEELQNQVPPGSPCGSEIIDPVGDVYDPAIDQPSTSAAVVYAPMAVDEPGPSYITPTAIYDDSQAYANYGERQLDLAQL